MAVSIAQYVDLLFKKLQGVAKTANSTVKGASNESIASPAFLRGDVVWMQSDQIPSTSQVVTGITSALTGGSSIQCVADTTVPPIGGIRPTWLTNETYWISQEFGSTWLPKVFVGPASAANIEATGTQIFSAGIGGVGEYYFDTQAGVLNFIGETIPSVLTVGNVVYVSGYQYVGDLGVTNIPSGANIGNLTITDTTITPTGNLVIFSGTSGVVVPSGNTAQRPDPAQTGTLRVNTALNQIEAWDGSAWISGTGGSGNVTIVDQQITPDGSNVTYTLDQESTNASILVSLNGVGQLPGTAYGVSGNSITFTQVPETTDIIDIRFLASATTQNQILNSSGNTKVQATDTSSILFTVASSNVATLTSTGFSVTGNITLGNIVNGNGNGTGNIGNASGYFNTLFAQATSAQYADLAEMYSADAVYAPGTVLSFGGSAEVTQSDKDADPTVAGVVSENPAYIMNAGLISQQAVALALTGRVKCQVQGTVQPGAMMVSAGNGRARAEVNPAMGTVIGKALEAFDGAEGTIEVVVGRL